MMTELDSAAQIGATRAPVSGHRARSVATVTRGLSARKASATPVGRGEWLRLLAHEDHQAAETALSAANEDVAGTHSYRVIAGKKVSLSG
jgi:hypothetical protein